MNKRRKQETSFEDYKYGLKIKLGLGEKSNVLCERFFDVYGVNDDFFKSIETTKLVNQCKLIIEDYLETKTLEYLWRGHRKFEYIQEPYSEFWSTWKEKNKEYSREDENRDIVIELTIKNSNNNKRETFVSTILESKNYSLHGFDVNKIIYDIQSEFHDFLTRDNSRLNFDVMGYSNKAIRVLN